jgi:thiol-disulfide isomerase/thioredoxin
MSHRRLLFSLLFALALGAIQCSSGNIDWVDESVEPGMDRPAPDFRLSDLKGVQVSLSGLKGKVVLLDFWATWCGPCRMSMPILEKLRERRPNDFVLLAVNVGEDKDDVASYARERNIRSTILLDSTQIVGRVYGASSIPMQILIDREGVVRHVMVSFRPQMGEELSSWIDRLNAAPVAATKE